jgi:hypothetical protein
MLSNYGENRQARRQIDFHFHQHGVDPDQTAAVGFGDHGRWGFPIVMMSMPKAIKGLVLCAATL